jgi:tRNA(Glu) U13 pseudouridine synthase TruD
VAAEERRWSAAADVDWSVFERGRPLASPGDRRALIVPFLEAPEIEKPAPDAGPGPVWLRFALPAGSYATEVLAQLGVALPARR